MWCKDYRLSTVQSLQMEFLMRCFGRSSEKNLTDSMVPPTTPTQEAPPIVEEPPAPRKRTAREFSDEDYPARRSAARKLDFSALQTRPQHIEETTILGRDDRW